jgi:hypothetical protein
MQCKITGADTTLLFTARILNKYDVNFYRCNDTGFIQTEEPYWLDEAYSSAITKLDVGLVYRNMHLKDTVSTLLANHFNAEGLFLDYAGGYGLFTRLMRDSGFNFYHTDKFCQNIFAEYFDITDLPDKTHFDIVTAFEVFEHLANPITEIMQMLQHSDNLLFSTELQPANIKSVDDWSYFSTETGQHVAFYTEASLKAIADQLGYNFYTDGRFLHLFTKTSFTVNPLVPAKDSFFLRKAKKFVKKAQRQLGIPESLLIQDWQYIKDKLNK